MHRMSAQEKELKMYEGEDVTVSMDKDLCLHVGECGGADNTIFVSGRKPWCDPDEAELETVCEIVERCPSGALSYQRKDGKKERYQEKNTLHIACDGPLYLRGQLEVEGVEQNSGARYRVALCRCGASKNKPFCDGEHREVGFQDYGAVGEAGERLAIHGRSLQIIPVNNGPLMVNGNLQIHAASGRLAWQGNKAALCRCGESANKPFCDGSHVEANFRSE